MSDDLRDASQQAELSADAESRGLGLFGVRKGAGYQEDSARLNPVHVIVAGLLAGAVFVGVLILIVRWAVSSLT